MVEGGAQKTKEFDMYADQFFNRVQKSIKERYTEDNPITSWVCIFDMDDYKVNQLASIPSKFLEAIVVDYCVVVTLLSWRLSTIPAVSFIVRLAEKFEKAARNMEYGYLINRK